MQGHMDEDALPEAQRRAGGEVRQMIQRSSGWRIGVALLLGCVASVQGFTGTPLFELRPSLSRRAVCPARIASLYCMEKRSDHARGSIRVVKFKPGVLHKRAHRVLQTLMSFSSRAQTPDVDVSGLDQNQPLISPDSPDGAFYFPSKRAPPSGGVYQTLWLHNELVTAVSTDDMEKAKELILNGADPNVVGPSGWSAFHWAVQFGSKNAVRSLLVMGAKTEIRSLTGHTALHRAAIQGDVDMVDLLVKEGKADVRARVACVSKATSTDDTALHLAASFRHLEVAKLLKELGADVFATDYRGMTARARALAVGNFEMSDFLALWEAEVKESRRLISRIENRMRSLLGSNGDAAETNIGNDEDLVAR